MQQFSRGGEEVEFFRGRVLDFSGRVLTLSNMAYFLHLITWEGAENNPLLYLEIYT